MKANSFLVTGNDLVGKTTLINQLIPYLNNLGIKTISNKNDLYKTSLMKNIQSLLEDANITKDFIQINSLFLVTFLIDAIKFKPNPNEVIIQDSYACRTIAFCHAYDLNPIIDLFDNYKNNFYSFDVTIHLDASIECRKKRLNTKLNTNNQDQLIFTDQEKVKKMDRYLSDYVKKHNNVLQIDTSELTISQVFEQVKIFIEDFI
jgi:dTMP kinase